MLLSIIYIDLVGIFLSVCGRHLTLIRISASTEGGTLCIMFLKTAEECYVAFEECYCVRTWNGAFLEIHILCTHFNLFCFQFCDGSEHPKTDHTLIGNMFVEDH
jgi:hypothetical protein